MQASINRLPERLREQSRDGFRPRRAGLGLRGDPSVDPPAQALREARLVNRLDLRRRSAWRRVRHFAALRSLTLKPARRWSPSGCGASNAAAQKCNAPALANPWTIASRLVTCVSIILTSAPFDGSARRSSLASGVP